MDKDTLITMVQALAESPDNMTLFWLVLRGYHELGDHEAACQLLDERRSAHTLPPLEMPDQEQLIGELYLQCGQPKTVLELCQENNAMSSFMRAKAYLALDNLEKGIEEYRNAVRHNPALEDKSLEKLLSAKDSGVVVNLHDESRKLRVISNDDTDQSELKRILMPEEKVVTFNEVGGLESIKTQIKKRIILPFHKPSLFQKFKKKVGGGILLFGPPGCGKTLLARATAGECKATFFNVIISDILDMYIGESERKLHALFETARQSTPAVLFFDEIEALGGKRQYTREGTSSKLVSQFLSEMDGYSNNNSGVLILGSTNVPWAIDPAFRRPGRFDRVLFVPPPDRVAREAILRIHLEGLPVDGDIDPTFIANKTSGFSGADLHHLIEMASDIAIELSMEQSQEVALTQKLFLQALKDVKPTTYEWLTTARNYARYANESGQYNDVLDFLKRFGKE